MSEAELISAIREASSLMTVEFEYWLTITFAVIVASHVTGKTLGIVPRMVISALYVSATTLFYLKYSGLLPQIAFFFEQLSEMGSNLPQPGLSTSYLRRGIMIAGTCVGIYSIIRPALSRLETETASAADT